MKAFFVSTLLVGSGLAVGCTARPAPRPSFFLFEKGPYQMLYDREGRLMRMAHDADANGRAEEVVLYDSRGKPVAAEIDSDRDGVVDRWEAFSATGALEKVGRARRKPGVPDAWEQLGVAGEVVRESLDEDGDGRVDHTLDYDQGRVVSEDLDTDGDGAMDRRLVRGAAGEVVRIEVDRRGSGRWEPLPIGARTR